MRFLLDESVSVVCVRALRALGHDAVHITAIGLAGAPDRVVLEREGSEDRVLITRDHHFTNPARFPLESHCGIIHVRPGNLTSEQEAALLERVIAGLRPADIMGHLVTVSRHRVNIR